METNLSPDFKKWIRKCLNDEFSDQIDQKLSEDKDAYDISQKIINSRDMTEISNSIRDTFIQKIESKTNSASNSRPQTSLSYISDVSVEDWSLKGNNDELGKIADQISANHPDHVRLAGYELLFETDFTQLYGSNSWPAILKALKDSLADNSRSIFESSLLVHGKLLSCTNFFDAYANLLNAFNEQYSSKKLYDTLPTLLSGINFKIFLHEKLFRIMKIIIDHHEELLKSIRTVDKITEEMLELFITFLSSLPNSNLSQQKPLNVLNILSVLEPQAYWFEKWMHSLLTRKTICNIISKSPNIIKTIMNHVNKGLKELPTSIPVTISDEPIDVYISGDSIETLTFFHCLHFSTELCKFSIGRKLLTDNQDEDSFSLPDFIIAILCSLNTLASSHASNGLYEVIRSAFKKLLIKPAVLYDSRFYQVLLNPFESKETKIWPHTLDALNHVIETVDGTTFLIAEYKTKSASSEKSNSNYPVITILNYASNILKQPVAVMSLEFVVELFNFIGKLFRIQDVFDIVESVLLKTLFPSISYFYSRIDRYYVENENKTQQIDKSVKEMLFKIVGNPIGLQKLSNEPLVFEELIKGSIAPVKVCWSAYDIVSFISNTGFMYQGAQILSELAPHVLSTLLFEICKTIEEPDCFHNPWDNINVNVFLHILSLFALNTNCFISFMTKINEEKEDEKNYPSNLYELFQQAIMFDSPYHYLALLSVKTVIFNLDIYNFLICLLNFQEKFLEFQEYSIFENTDELELKKFHVVDEFSMLRHSILLNSLYIKHKTNEFSLNPEDIVIFSKPPVLGNSDNYSANKEYHIDLKAWLKESSPGLRDDNWVSEARKSYKSSSDPLENSVVLDVLYEMQKAIPIVEWVENLKWIEENEFLNWLPEDECGINLALHYASLNTPFKEIDQLQSDLKDFIQTTHNFINYKKSINFEGFDWFLTTIFLICNGINEKAKHFISKMIHFPCAEFMWPALSQVIDEKNQDEASNRLLVAHLIESIINKEFPSLKFALKNKYGIDWWMICDRLIAQCFWGILPWSEIVHYFTICILHPPDYIVYYCVSLLNHCTDEIMKNISQNKMWPENMIFEDYRCYSQFGFMDRLAKRYGGKILPVLTQKNLNLSD